MPPRLLFLVLVRYFNYNSLMHRERFVVLDTETTGFKRSDRVLEIGLAFFEDGGLVTTWGTRLSPKGVNWDSPSVQSALAINCIDPASLVGKPTFREVYETLMDWLSRYTVWVGHNFSFDLRMIRQECELSGLQPPLSRMKPEAVLCTQKLFEWVIPEGKHKLANACEQFGVNLVEAHTAVADAVACGEVLISLVQRDDVRSNIGRLVDLPRITCA